ncbi:MAG: hypothetical protein MUF72_09765 [Elainella sp. Prado103]|jgi:hypothetical protein|nr:hypothetical protein [Elainella sp. Prado103]
MNPIYRMTIWFSVVAVVITGTAWSSRVQLTDRLQQAHVTGQPEIDPAIDPAIPATDLAIITLALNLVVTDTTSHTTSHATSQQRADTELLTELLDGMTMIFRSWLNQDVQARRPSGRRRISY